MEDEHILCTLGPIIDHIFYCDECGAYIGKSREYDDGWYDTLGEVEFSFYIDRWYRVKKCLCGNCAAKFIENLKATLKDFGFKEG